VLNVFVPEVGLQGAGVMSLVGQGVAAGVSEHVRVRFEPELGFGACSLDHAGKPCGGEWRAPLGSEHEGRLGLLFALEPPKAAQLVPPRIGCVLGVPFLTPRTRRVAVLKST
jgi:hypothetical protein